MLWIKHLLCYVGVIGILILCSRLILIRVILRIKDPENRKYLLSYIESLFWYKLAFMLCGLAIMLSTEM